MKATCSAIESTARKEWFDASYAYIGALTCRAIEDMTRRSEANTISGVIHEVIARYSQARQSLSLAPLLAGTAWAHTLGKVRSHSVTASHAHSRMRLCLLACTLGLCTSSQYTRQKARSHMHAHLSAYITPPSALSPVAAKPTGPCNARMRITAWSSESFLTSTP